ncbi:MAG TPA: DNRLRE domain-containing protein [Terriglobales bacterium]
MKNSKTRLAILLLLTLGLLASAHAQITPIGDAYTNTADPTTNYGSKTLLDVESASQTTYIQFDLSVIPAGYTSADITKASLKLYVSAVTKAGSFNVDYVNGTWSESTITASNAPALGSTIAASVSLTTTDKNQYILIDITPALQAWLSGSQPNDGIALVANSPLNASFDSKENTTTSHSSELDIVFAGGGTITGVTTASGSGLTGGGTSGTLNLALTNACAANQVLQWNGSSWVCAAVGNGTITGVTAGTDLSGGGSSGNVTLNLNTAATNALYAQLAAANTFTGNQTVGGNLSATGVVTGSAYQIGSNLFAFGSYANANAFLGFAGNMTTSGQYNTALGIAGLSKNTSGGNNTAIGGVALASNTTGAANTATGVSALEFNTTGVFNTASGVTALTSNTTGNSNTATGLSALNKNITGSSNTGIGAVALQYNTTGGNNTGIGVYALQYNTTGSFNTALGYSAGPSPSNINNATAIGANALVVASNSLVLGSINGVNSATADTNVGIGTTAPSNPLTVVGNSTYIPVAIQSNSTFGTWMTLGNTSTGGATWNILSAASGNSEGAGNLAFTNFNSNSTIYIHSNLHVDGTISKGGGSFQIDHPLDPANKYLYHSFVESPDMMNVYNGNIVTNQRGVAIVVLPDYFEALNRDFRYQLTVMGQFAEAIVAKKIGHNRFVIRTSKPNVEVSWQVTGIRHDAYADAHRIPTEEMKPPDEQGRYLHPELFGAPAERAIGYLALPAQKKSTTESENAQASSLKAPRAPLK